MKKLLLASLALVAMSFGVKAETVTFDFTKDNYGLTPYDSSSQPYLENPETATNGAVSITFAGEQDQAWRMWSDGLREYNKKNPTFTVKVNGYNVTGVTFTAASNVTFKVDGYQNGENITAWAGDAESVTFIGTASGNAAVKTISVTYGEAFVDPGTPEIPEYTVAEAIAQANSGFTGTVIVTGIVTRTTNFNSNYGSVTYFISDNGEAANELQIYGGLGLNGAKFTSQNDVAVGATVKVKGDLLLYNGTTPEINTNNILLEYKAPEGGDNPDVPTIPTETISVAKALELIKAGATGEATVKGFVASITEVSTQYGNATYALTDDPEETGAETLQVYRGYWLDGTKFTTGNEIAVGGEIVVKGTLVNYGGNTPQFTTGSQVVSYTAPEGGETPEPDTPTSDFATFDFTDPASLTPAQTPGDATEIDVTGVTFTSGVISMLSEAPETASTKPRLWLSSGNWTYRFYNESTITISAAEGYAITSVVFDGTNLGHTSIVYSDNGSFNSNTWTATAATGVSSMTFTKTATGNNPTVKTIKVYYKASGNSGVEAVAAEVNAPVEYFNLQGVRVENPTNGLYIRREGTKVTKVIL